ncbi:holo-[acyl-carrier protein] synthase [Cryptococcus gattii E566]|uniref:4'-phosphopantetheinyl transferase domain-containing protein n=2 Tax=Cryptococcus gattii TaxID=37769 RepID=E6RBB7_CRYGW|nr:Hypothetical protein CGB_H5170W [Cryptococcus gattii WM276]ADV24110.1 Hypothetical protein CGB_H5170W [Cryptococcus gattii WM276]KIR81225.1 holo-[acyl-carrier protein] synthase [Cryptococcus gattii EJB2]KIY34856.1 holo-[acyl-carrier protein] synthase [Cryptococcus gattii E566]KJE01074.1 holo-[acyl-carrier protein] synthase [Cryptococcus gattii NT-10]
MLSGLGIDILSLTRFRDFVIRRGAEKVAKRLCTPGELVRFDKLARGSVTRPLGPESVLHSSKTQLEDKASVLGTEDILDRQVRFLSSRWCIKEAAYKSLSPLLPRPPSFKTFELVHSSTGQPRLDIITEAKDKYVLLSSLSHDAGVVVGVVIAMDKTFHLLQKGGVDIPY